MLWDYWEPDGMKKVTAEAKSRWENATEDQRQAAYYEMTDEEMLADAFAAFEEGYKFRCHPDLIMNMLYSCKKDDM